MHSLAPVGMQWQRWTTEMELLVTDARALDEARALVDAELDAIELAASRFRADSEVCALARTPGIRTPVSPVLAGLIEAALTAARMTDGDVDPTVGSALVELGYDTALPAPGTALPRLVSVAVQADWTCIEFDGETIRLPEGTLLDFGATAKAFAADRCAHCVHQRTGSGVLVNLGGDISTAGQTPDGGWQVMVQDSADDPASQIALNSDAGLATSSTQRRRWSRAGQALHHILDPRTGAPADPVWRTVSVAASSCLTANTFSTAAIVRGRRAPEWVAGLGVPARFVDRDGEVSLIGGWPL